MPTREDRIGRDAHPGAGDGGDGLAALEIDQNRPGHVRGAVLVSPSGETRNEDRDGRHHDAEPDRRGDRSGSRAKPSVRAVLAGSRRSGWRRLPRCLRRCGCDGRLDRVRRLPRPSLWRRRRDRARRSDLLKGRILLQDLPMELLERRPRVDAELLGQRPPGAVERKQRLSLPPRPIEGRHQLAPQILPEGIAGRQ
jgi:pimeloyl-ACP methyl ester carboxylesterase